MYRIIPTTHIMKKVQYFIPKSKKKRIQRKAAKLYTRLVVDKETVVMDHCNRIIYCHPEVQQALSKFHHGGIVTSIPQPFGMKGPEFV